MDNRVASYKINIIGRQTYSTQAESCFLLFYSLCLLTYKALHGFAPDYITSLLKRYIPTRGDTDGDPVIENSPRRSNDHFLLQKPTYNYTKSSLTKRSFSYAAPDLWNQLPYTIRSCNSKDIFAGRLKTHLFSSFVNDPLKIV